MKTLAVFLLFLSVATTFATKSSSKMLEQIQKDEFGKTLLNLIDMNMRLKTPVSEVQSLLNEVLNNLLADLQLLVSNYNQQSAATSAAIDNGNSLISGYQNAIRVLTDLVSNSQNTLQSKQTDLQNNQNSLSSETSRLSTLQQNYDSYVPNAQADIDSLANAIAAIKTAIARMQSYQSAGVDQLSLIEVSSNTKKDIKKVTATLEAMKETMSKKSSIYTPVVRELLDLTENMSQDKAQKVIDLLNKLLQLLEDTRSLVQVQLATFITTSESQRASATRNIATYQNNIAQLTTDLANLQQTIQQSQNDIDSTRQLLSGAQDKLVADQQSLQNLNDTYNKQDDRYKKLIPLIRKVIQYFNTNVAGGDEYAVAAANSS